MSTGARHPSISTAALVGARKARGLTRAQLAGKTGIDRSQLWRIETGRATPYPHTVERLAEALEMPASRLLAPA